MSLSDCSTCLETPCICGEGYRDWSDDRLRHQIGTLTAIVNERHTPKVRTLTPILDGRRRPTDLYPHLLDGWLFLGTTSSDGTALVLPTWVSARIHTYADGSTTVKTTKSSLPVRLVIGDWVVRPRAAVREVIERLTGHEVAQWYTVS